MLPCLQRHKKYCIINTEIKERSISHDRGIATGSRGYPLGLL